MNCDIYEENWHAIVRNILPSKRVIYDDVMTILRNIRQLACEHMTFRKPWVFTKKAKIWKIGRFRMFHMKAKPSRGALATVCWMRLLMVAYMMNRLPVA